MQHNKQSSTRLACLIWFLAALFYFYEFLLQVSPGVMIPELLHTFKANAEQLGFMSSAYFYAYAFMQIPVGVLLDRFGARRIMTIACIICALGSALFALSNGVGMGALGRALTGLGSSVAAIGCMTIAAHWFSTKRFALLAGLVITLGMLGATSAGAPLAFMIDHIGWRTSMFVLAGVGLILSIFLFAIVRDYPPAKHAEFHADYQNLFAGLKHVLKSKQSWIASAYGGLIYAPTLAFAALWGVPALVAIHHVARPTAAFMVSLIFIGWAIGSPISGWASDHIQRRKPPMYCAAIFSLIFFSLAIYLPAPAWIIGLLLFLYGFVVSGFLLSFSIVREINPHRYSATSLGFINMLNMLGGAIAQPLIGKILDATSKHTAAHHQVHYSAHSYEIALALLPCLLLLALISLPFVKETFCKSINQASKPYRYNDEKK